MALWCASFAQVQTPPNAILSYLLVPCPPLCNDTWVLGARKPLSLPWWSWAGKANCLELKAGVGWTKPAESPKHGPGGSCPLIPSQGSFFLPWGFQPPGEEEKVAFFVVEEGVTVALWIMPPTSRSTFGAQVASSFSPLFPCL